MRSLAAAITLLSLPGMLAGKAFAWTWPVRGEVVTPFHHGGQAFAAGQHRGVDIAARPGTRVRAARGGRVAFAGFAGSSGLTVSVLTADGRLRTTYLHLRSATVARGERVREGQPIGRSGTSGRGSAAEPHLHFGIRRQADPHGYLDPLMLLPPPRLPRTAPPASAPAREPRPVAPPPRREPLARPAHAFDPGWALACLCLLAAAAAMGRRARRPAVSSIGRPWPTTSQPRSTT